MLNELKDFNLGLNPVENFLNWYSEAIKVEDNADAMTLSTYDEKTKRPHSRTLLYKGLENNQIIFYTNYLSKKAEQINDNQEVSLLFYWHKSIRQVRIQGHVQKSSRELSTKYFASRDRESQLASFISKQSHSINSKSELLEKLEKTKAEYNGREIPCPENWGGYLLTPYEFEFFIYGKNRLNDRFLFVKNKNNEWEISRLQP